LTKYVHFIGIGGISMSGIAKILLNNGIKVSGSDISMSDSVKELIALGADVQIGHRAENITNQDIVVYTSAVHDDNPEMIAAKQKGLKVYIATLLPICGWRTYAPFRDEVRCQFNDWIRTTDEIDGFIDFDKALQNPEKPEALEQKYDSGDHLHPSIEGHKRLAAEIPKELF